jgi:TetR/AcrR family transcriptional regulator, fatty acid metabolism regulator protein
MSAKEPTRRQLQALETRQKIFDTALALLVKKGYDRVTVDDICAAAGVSKGTFYHHFKSKDQAILEEFLKIDRYYQEILPGIMQLSDIYDRMTEFTRLALAYMEKQGKNLMKVAYYSQISPDRKSSPVASSDRALYSIVSGLILDAQERGEVRSDLDSMEVAETLIRAIRGIVYDWCLQDGGFDMEEAGKALSVVLADGLRPR